MVGNSSVGVVLKDVSLEVHGGELMAVLGSKGMIRICSYHMFTKILNVFYIIEGSGKKTLLDVIARRAQGPTRGQILLNGVPMSMRLFQDSCAYIGRKCHLLDGLNVKQTLFYAAHLTIGNQTIFSFVKKKV